MYSEEVVNVFPDFTDIVSGSQTLSEVFKILHSSALPVLDCFDGTNVNSWIIWITLSASII